MSESLVPPKSTCITLGLSQKNTCSACELWKNSTRKGGNRKPCIEGWNDTWKDSTTVRYKIRYESIWDELNSKKIEVDMDGEEEVNQGRRRSKRSKRKRSERNPPSSLFSRIQLSTKKRFRGLIGKHDETHENVELRHDVEMRHDEDLAERLQPSDKRRRIEIQSIQTPTPVLDERFEYGNASSFLQTVQKSVRNGLSALGSKIKGTFQPQNNAPPVAPRNLDTLFQSDPWRLQQSESNQQKYNRANRSSRLYCDVERKRAPPIHTNLQSRGPPHLNIDPQQVPPVASNQSGNPFFYQDRQQIPLNGNQSEQYLFSAPPPVSIHLHHSNVNIPINHGPGISDSDLAKLFHENGDRLGYINTSDESAIDALASELGYERDKPWSTTINTSYKVKMETNNKYVNNLRTYLKRQRFEGREISKRLYGICAALSPNCSFASLEMTAGLSRAGLAEDMSILSHLEANIEDIPNISPGEDTIANYLAIVATDILFLLHLELSDEEIRVFLNCDKGQNDAFIKILSWWCKDKQKVKTAFLDIDKTGGTSVECARAIQFSTERLSIEDFIYAGATTDSGGGGVGASLQRELRLLDLIDIFI